MTRARFVVHVDKVLPAWFRSQVIKAHRQALIHRVVLVNLDIGQFHMMVFWMKWSWCRHLLDILVLAVFHDRSHLSHHLVGDGVLFHGSLDMHTNIVVVAITGATEVSGTAVEHLIIHVKFDEAGVAQGPLASGTIGLHGSATRVDTCQVPVLIHSGIDLFGTLQSLLQSIKVSWCYFVEELLDEAVSATQSLPVKELFLDSPEEPLNQIVGV